MLAAGQPLTGYWLLILISLLLLIGVIVLMALARTWRRWLDRTRGPKAAAREDLPDIWRTSAQRLQARMDEEARLRERRLRLGDSPDDPPDDPDADTPDGPDSPDRDPDRNPDADEKDPDRPPPAPGR